jgi:hypothetical protein
MHRPLAPQHNLGDSFAWQVDRTVTYALTVQYDRVMILLEPSEVTPALPRALSGWL